MAQLIDELLLLTCVGGLYAGIVIASAVVLIK